MTWEQAKAKAAQSIAELKAAPDYAELIARETAALKRAHRNEK
jgi:hypothetical protein